MAKSAKNKLETAQDKLNQAALEVAPFRPIEDYPPAAINVNSQPSATTFNPENYLASNLFSDTSPLPRTTKLEADKGIQSISEKRETLRLVSANLQLNTDVYKAGSLSEKMSQSSITWQTDRIGTQNKLVGL
jgi:hypothetical protein